MAGKGKNQHVVKRDEGWAVRGEGNSKDTSHHRTQQEAADAARQAAAEADERQKRLQQRIQRARDLALAAARAEMEQVLKVREAARQAQLLEQKRQAQLQRMGVCVAGYEWIKQSGGYRCAGGSHFVSDAQLQ